MTTSNSKKRGNILYHLMLATMFAAFFSLALDAPSRLPAELKANAGHQALR